MIREGLRLTQREADGLAGETGCTSSPQKTQLPRLTPNSASCVAKNRDKLWPNSNRCPVHAEKAKVYATN